VDTIHTLPTLGTIVSYSQGLSTMKIVSQPLASSTLSRIRNMTRSLSKVYQSSLFRKLSTKQNFVEFRFETLLDTKMNKDDCITSLAERIDSSMHHQMQITIDYAYSCACILLPVLVCLQNICVCYSESIPSALSI